MRQKSNSPLVDGPLKEADVFCSKQQVTERVLDSNNLERGREIVILAKNTVISIYDAKTDQLERIRKLAQLFFCYYNPPGSEVISGSQDSAGIIFPGLAKAEWRLRLQITIWL